MGTAKEYEEKQRLYKSCNKWKRDSGSLFAGSRDLVSTCTWAYNPTCHRPNPDPES